MRWRGRGKRFGSKHNQYPNLESGSQHSATKGIERIRRLSPAIRYGWGSDSYEKDLGKGEETTDAEVQVSHTKMYCMTKVPVSSPQFWCFPYYFTKPVHVKGGDDAITDVHIYNMDSVVVRAIQGFGRETNTNLKVRACATLTLFESVTRYHFRLPRQNNCTTAQPVILHRPTPSKRSTVSRRTVLPLSQQHCPRFNKLDHPIT